MRLLDSSPQVGYVSLRISQSGLSHSSGGVLVGKGTKMDTREFSGTEVGEGRRTERSGRW